MFKQLKLIIAAILVFTPFSANAILITSNTISLPTIIDFSTQSPTFSVSGPIQIGGSAGEDITLTGNPNNGLYVSNSGWGLGNNGSWGNGMTFVAANSARPGDLIFSFNDGPISAVGGFMNYAPSFSGDLEITALDLAMNVLESYNITSLADIVTPGGFNDGAFRGIDRGGLNDISHFVVSGYVPVVDDLTFARSSATVPEPGTLALLGLGLAGMGMTRRKKNLKK